MRSLSITFLLFLFLTGCSPALPPKGTPDSPGLLKSHREETERCRAYAERATKEREKSEAYLLKANEILAEVRRVEEAGLHAQKACKAKRVREAKAVKEAAVVNKVPLRDLAREAKIQREREALLQEYSPSDAPPGIYEKLQAVTTLPKPTSELAPGPTTDNNVGSNVSTPVVVPQDSHSGSQSGSQSGHQAGAPTESHK